MQFRNFKMVGYVVYGRGSFNQLNEIIKPHRKTNAPIIFLVDHYFEDKPLANKIPLQGNDKLIFVDVSYEPKTTYVDKLANDLKEEFGTVSGVIGIGGGSAMVNLTPQAISILKWAEKKMLEEAERNKLAETNPAIKDLISQIKQKEEQISILEESLKGSSQVIVDILSRFIFEQNVFDARKKTPLNVRMLNELMLESQKEAYGDSLDPEFMSPYAWLNKPHYYRGGLSFYNFPYAFGLLFAKGIYAEFIKQGEPFVDKVNLLLQKTGQMTVEDVASLVGIDLSSKEFWNSSLDVIVDEINLFLELTK